MQPTSLQPPTLSRLWKSWFCSAPESPSATRTPPRCRFLRKHRRRAGAHQWNRRADVPHARQLNPQLIYALVPSSVSPANGVHYATFQVVNNASSSKQVTLNTNYTAPGLFAISQGGVGDAAALDGNTLITAANPAKISDTIEMFGTGFGSVYPLIVPEGAGASSVQPFNLVTANTSITVDNWDATLPYVGMAPGYIGEYQINLTVPTIASGDWFMYLESYDPVGLDGGLNVETTLNVSGASAGAGVTSHTTRTRPLRVSIPAFRDWRSESLFRAVCPTLAVKSRSSAGGSESFRPPIPAPVENYRCINPR